MQSLKIRLEDLPVSLKVEDVALVLGISRGGAYNLMKSKNFPAIRIGRRIIVPRDPFLHWIEKKAEEAII
jgi:excisionase family DNA binding protein